jgi:uncharacterized membrane protein YgdD (TMEM256/DUF423 family)
VGREFLAIAAISGFLAVALGAFGAHALKVRLSPELLSAYQTGVQYHFYHTGALFVCALLLRSGLHHPALHAAAYCYIAGMILFSGSLYGLAISGQRWLGMVTPVGGITFLLGWLALWVGILRSDW